MFEYWKLQIDRSGIVTGFRLCHLSLSYFESWLTDRGGPTLEAREQLRKRTETPRPSSSESGKPARVRMFRSSHQPRQSIM